MGGADKTIKKAGRDINKAVTGKDTTDVLGYALPSVGLFDSQSSLRKDLKNLTSTPSNPDIAIGEDAASDSPSYIIDTEAAKRRKRALSLRRGFLSTVRANGESGEASTLQPALTGKTKLGQ